MLNRHEVLKGVHDTYRPRSYLEVGVNDGRSLTLSRTSSIAVDPAFKITSEIHCDVEIVKATSDDFFARADPVARFPDEVIDFAFIDGLHLFEFALRDFMNVERHSAWTSVIVFDDVYPRSIDEAARERHTSMWTGDVFKVIPVLRRYRPDLIYVPLDTQPTGLLMVLGADPMNTTLQEHYDEIVDEYITGDPQVVSEEILLRTAAADAEQVLRAPFWADLIRAREGALDRQRGYQEFRSSVHASLGESSRSDHVAGAAGGGRRAGS